MRLWLSQSPLDVRPLRRDAPVPMARMIPATGPRGGARCPPAEAWVYDRLARGLDERWTVVHGAPWVGRARPGEPLRDGEATFVVAHPLHGLLVLEVQGGGLRFEPSSGTWTRTDATGSLDVIPDPYRTASHAAEAIVAKLGEHPLASALRPTFGHGVVLPDIQVPGRGFAPHASAEITLDLRQRDKLADGVVALLKRWGKDHPALGLDPNSWWWRAFEDLFLAPRDARVLLRDRIHADRERMIELSEPQLRVLDMLARRRRQAVHGTAGTGKTLLAIRKAELLARQGQRVLLTCYNKALGHHLRDALAHVPNVKALHFHELCFDLADLQRRGIEVPQEPRAAQQFYDVELAEHLAHAAKERGITFDALVVDEAQDFLPNWWRALDALFVDPQRSIRYSFFDQAQRLRADAAPVEGADEAVELVVNWRNTRAIHEHLTQVEPRMRAADCAAPPGLPVEVEPLTPTYAKALVRVLTRLCGQGAVKPEEIVLLTGRAPARSRAVREAAHLLPFRVTTADEPGAIRVRGVQAFKGMEAPVVVLTELPDDMPERARQLHYIGASRATSHLVVLADAVIGGGAP